MIERESGNTTISRVETYTIYLCGTKTMNLNGICVFFLTCPCSFVDTLVVVAFLVVAAVTVVSSEAVVTSV